MPDAFRTLGRRCSHPVTDLRWTTWTVDQSNAHGNRDNIREAFTRTEESSTDHSECQSHDMARRLQSFPISDQRSGSDDDQRHHLRLRRREDSRTRSRSARCFHTFELQRSKFYRSMENVTYLASLRPSDVHWTRKQSICTPSSNMFFKRFNRSFPLRRFPVVSIVSIRITLAVPYGLEI